MSESPTQPAEPAPPRLRRAIRLLIVVGLAFGAGYFGAMALDPERILRSRVRVAGRDNLGPQVDPVLTPLSFDRRDLLRTYGALIAEQRFTEARALLVELRERAPTSEQAWLKALADRGRQLEILASPERQEERRRAWLDDLGRLLEARAEGGEAGPALAVLDRYRRLAGPTLGPELDRLRRELRRHVPNEPRQSRPEATVAAAPKPAARPLSPKPRRAPPATGEPKPSSPAAPPKPAAPPGMGMAPERAAKLAGLLDEKRRRETVLRRRRVLERHFTDKSHVMRALAGIAIIETNDPLAVGALVKPLTDDKMLPRVVTVSELSELSLETLRQSPEAADLIKALIAGMPRNRVFRARATALLGALSGQSFKTIAGWQGWAAVGFPGARLKPLRALDFSGFSSAELARHGAPVGVGRTVERRPASEVDLKDKTGLETIARLRREGLEVALCLDVTGSMEPALESARAELDNLRVILGDLIGSFRLALVAYRDQVVLKHNLSSNLRSLRKALYRVKAASGGDRAEGPDKALLCALTELSWRKTANKSVVLIGDAPPHGRDRKLFGGLARFAADHRVRIHALMPRGAVAEFQDAARVSGGRVMTLATDHAFLKQFLTLVLGDEMAPVMNRFLAIYIDLLKMQQRLQKPKNGCVADEDEAVVPIPGLDRRLARRTGAPETG